MTTEPENDDLSFLADVEVPALEEVSELYPDEFPAAVKFAFIGLGQAGGRFADMAYNLRWRKVVALNTSQEDLRNLEHLPADRRMQFGTGGGAGKDPKHGLKQVSAASGDILNLLIRKLGRDVEQIIVAVGGGGGTGSGGVIAGEGKNLLQTVHDYAELIAPDAPQGKPKIGVLCTMPTLAEGAPACRTAVDVLTQLFDLVERGEISPLFIVDNNRITRLWSQATVTDMFQRSNALILNTLQAFVAFATKDGIITFDRQDLRTVLASGAVTFGMMDVEDPSNGGLSMAVRKNPARGVLAEGFDLSKSKVGAVLVTAQKEVLDRLQTKDFDEAVESFSHLIGNSTVHRGLFKGAFPKVRVYVMIGGLPRPEARLAEFARKSS